MYHGQGRPRSMGTAALPAGRAGARPLRALLASPLPFLGPGEDGEAGEEGSDRRQLRQLPPCLVKS